MEAEGEGEKKDGGWKEILLKSCLYTVFFLMIYAMFIGFKMSGMISSGGEIPGLLKTAHVHTLLNSVIMLFLIYDLRIKNAAGKASMHSGIGEILIGAGVLGLLISTAGFSVAAIYPPMIATGLSIAHIGLPLLFLAFFAYVLVAMMAEMYE